MTVPFVVLVVRSRVAPNAPDMIKAFLGAVIEEEGAGGVV